MLLHGRHLISPFGLKRYSGKLLSRAGKEQGAQTLVPVHMAGWRGFVCWDLRFPGDIGLSPGYGYKQSLPQPQGSWPCPKQAPCSRWVSPPFPAPSCCCWSRLPLQQLPGTTGGPVGWAGVGPVPVPQPGSRVARDSHSAICVSEEQLRCILKTQERCFSFLWCVGRPCSATLPPFLFFLFFFHLFYYFSI